MKSTKTTVAGILGGLGLILTQVYFAIDTDPQTVFSITEVFAGLAMMGIGWFARDNDVTSEKAGAK